MTRRGPVPIAVTGLLVLVLIVGARLQRAHALRRRHHLPGRVRRGRRAAPPGDMVTIAGVEAGRVTDVELAGDRVLVTFRVSDAWVGDRTSASIEIKTLLGAKYLALDPQGDQDLDPDTPDPAGPHRVPVRRGGGVRRALRHDRPDRHRRSSRQSLHHAVGHLPRHTPGGPRRARRAVAAVHHDREPRRGDPQAARRHPQPLRRARRPERGVREAALRRQPAARRDPEAPRRDQRPARRHPRAVASSCSGLVADNREQLRPTLEQLDRVAALLQRNRDALDASLQKEAVFVRLFTNAVGNGEWFDNYVCGLFPPPLGPINPGGC